MRISEKPGTVHPDQKETVSFKPCLIVLSGIPLTGKTVLAEELARRSNVHTIDVDRVRHEIDESRKGTQVTMLEAEAEKAIMIQSYTEMCRRAEELLTQASPVVISGTFSRDEFKEPLEGLMSSLQRMGIPHMIFLLTMPDDEALRRISNRKKTGDFSNIGTLEKYEWAKGIFKKIEASQVIEIDTSKGNYVETTLTYLEELKTDK